MEYTTEEVVMTTTETATIKGQLKSSCCCQWCPTCEMFTEDDKCDECSGEVEYSQTGCNGLCWEYAYEDMDTYLKEWMEATKAEAFAIYGQGMGWRRVSGHTGRLENIRDLVDNMTFNGDWIIEWTFDPAKSTFEMVRRSHDEMGACFELRPWHEGDDE